MDICQQPLCTLVKFEIVEGINIYNLFKYKQAISVCKQKLTVL